MADTRLYSVLGVSKNASEAEIRREYHKLAKRYHPDRNSGNEERFREIQEAYEILSDSSKREIYDRYGLDRVKGESSGMGEFSFGGGGGEGIFSHLFGGDMFGGFGGGRRRRAKAETVGIPLEVTLEELYSGATKSVEFKRKELCKTCKGAGGRQNATSRCHKCKGSGIEIKLRQIGPGMMQQIQSTCSDCGGSGEFIREKDRCKKCRGKRTVEVTHKLEVPVSPGMVHEQKLPFRGEADQIPDGEAGDVIVVLQQTSHSFFRREELDLFVDKKITLRQALCGFSFSFEHLDGRKIKVACSPGEVLSPNCVRAVEGEGMHDYRHHNLKGNIYFVFDVTFPENGFLDEANLQKLEKLLPARPDEPEADDEMEEVHMMDYEGTRDQGGQRAEAYDEQDEDDGYPSHGGQRVGCQQQ